MDKNQPDKWIRKAISEAINNINVNGFEIPCYDTRVTTDQNSEEPSHFILMTTQSNEVDKNNKCEWFWNSSILLDIFTYFELPGNTGSRLLVDDIAEAVKNETNNLVLDVASDLRIITQSVTYPPDISSETKKSIIFRKFIRLSFLIK